MGQHNTASTSLAPRTSEAAELIHSLDPRVVMLPNRALTTEVEADKATISTLKKFGLNLVTLPSEALNTLQDGVIAKL